MSMLHDQDVFGKTYKDEVYYIKNCIINSKKFCFYEPAKVTIFKTEKPDGSKTYRVHFEQQPRWHIIVCDSYDIKSLIGDILSGMLQSKEPWAVKSAAEKLNEMGYYRTGNPLVWMYKVIKYWTNKCLKSVLD